tara:strand:+ start:818 stop:1468 length:651 start_codon:yes stop_codon:yes gene_type:complete
MNKLMILGLFVMSLSPFASAEWETSGFIGVQSEYFFRGESQGDDRANQMGLHLENDSGLFGGVWVSEVGIYGNSNWEHDFYAGYKHNMSENVDLYGGVIKYDFDHEWLKIGPDDNGDTSDLKEAYIGGSYKSVSLEHYVDLDNSELTYTEFGYDLPLGLAMIDLKMTWGLLNGDDDVLGLKATRAFGDWDISVMAMEHSRHGGRKEHSSFGIKYNF